MEGLPCLLWLLLVLPRVATPCPSVCDCKWKSGKDSALCLNANLTTVPQDLDSGLQLLDMGGNPLVSLPGDAFSKPGLLNLQRLYLAKCRIRTLDRFAFRGLSNLVELDLSSNLLSRVPSESLEWTSELRELKLSGNPIQRLQSEAFLSVPRLVKLELAECRLSVVESRAFAGLEDSLVWLKLNDNRLVEVRGTSLTVLKKLQGLELAGNPWNCSCRLRPVKLWTATRKISFSAPPSCRTPTRLAARTWDRLDDAEFACPPSVAPLPSLVTSEEGVNVTLSCSVSGSPSPDVRWLWKNRPVSNATTPTSHRKVYVLSHVGGRSSLTLISADLSDAGLYFCHAANRAGRAQANVTLVLSRRRPESLLTPEVVGLGAGGALLFLLLSCLLFLYLGGGRKGGGGGGSGGVGGGGKGESSTRDRYEKIELKTENCYPRLANPDSHNKVHPKNCEYRGLPASEDLEEETSQSSLIPRSNHSTTNRESSSGLSGGEVSWVAEHVLRKEVLPTTSLYTTAAPLLAPRRSPSQPAVAPAPGPLAAGSSAPLSAAAYHQSASTGLPPAELLLEPYPDLLGRPPPPPADLPLLSPAATLPRRSCRDGGGWRVTSSQSPLLAGSRCGSSAGESSIGRRSSIESRASSYYPRTNNGGGGERSRCERSASSLDLFEAEAASWRRPSLPASPLRHRLSTQATETPILNLLGSAVYDLHAAELERFLAEYRTLQEELNRMKETCEGLATTPRDSASYPLYSDLYPSQ